MFVAFKEIILTLSVVKNEFLKNLKKNGADTCHP